MKSALIVSPYLDHLGGGERYMFTAACVLQELGYALTFAWDNAAELETIAAKLNLKLGNFALSPSAKRAYFQGGGLAMYLATRGYDLVVYLSDGSLPVLGGKKNLVHFQVPFHGVQGKSLTNRLKQRRIHAYLVNSQFTKQVIDQEYGIASTVVYPPVIPIPPVASKEPYILSVGRFDRSLNVKRQDVLIQAFAELAPALPGWQLILAGGTADPAWVEELRRRAAHLPVTIETNLSHAALVKRYQHARIYWHAAGYGVDERLQPELTEHFGISTVEAVSAGAIPLVVPRGGQKEIITDPAYHWETLEELKTKTLALSRTPSRYPDVSANYSTAKFKEAILACI